MTDPKLIIVEAQMLIRKPASEVFNAFIDPSITQNFWFTKGSDILEVGKKVTWEWEMYGVSWTVSAKEIVMDKKIVLDESPAPTTIEFHFKQLSEITTYVTIKQYGFDETGDELIEKIKDLTGGWTTVLDGAKIYLEHNINPNFTADKFPKEATDHH